MDHREFASVNEPAEIPFDRPKLTSFAMSRKLDLSQFRGDDSDDEAPRGVNF